MEVLETRRANNGQCRVAFGKRAESPHRFPLPTIRERPLPLLQTAILQYGAAQTAQFKTQSRLLTNTSALLIRSIRANDLSCPLCPLCEHQAFALQIIEDTHQQWESLIAGKVDSKISLKATTVGPQQMSAEEAAAVVNAAPAPAPPAAFDSSGKRLVSLFLFAISVLFSLFSCLPLCSLFSCQIAVSLSSFVFSLPFLHCSPFLVSPLSCALVLVSLSFFLSFSPLFLQSRISVRAVFPSCCSNHLIPFLFLVPLPYSARLALCYHPVEHGCCSCPLCDTWLCHCGYAVLWCSDGYHSAVAGA